MILEKEITQLIHHAIEKLHLSPVPLLLEKPKQKDHGDVATNVAFPLATQTKRSPRELARDLVDQMKAMPKGIEKVEMAGPGFINFYIKQKAYFEKLSSILKEEKKYGQSQVGKGQKVLLEFVSANPTGPLNIVSARAAAFGDALANILETVGYQVQREYYINDVGNQMTLFGKSLLARYLQAKGKSSPIPEEGYHGEYVKELAEGLLHQAAKDYSEEEITKLGLEKMVASQKASLQKFGVVFDQWFHQSELFRRKEIGKTIKQLEKKGYLYSKEGALFFKSTQFGDDKDRVVQKQDGDYSYFASDIAYHDHKYKRKFQWVIDIFGPDHHGYIPRTKAAVQALGHGGKEFTVLIVQQVNLLRGQEVIKMSKRKGQLITMDALVDEVGKEVARYFFLQRSASSPLDFDLELAKKETLENPVFYIQYAHARIASIFAKANEEPFKTNFRKLSLECLDLPEEKELAKQLLDFPDVLRKAAFDLEPHSVAFYLLELAKLFQGYYSQARQDPRYKVLNREALERTNAKLYLLKNIQIVLQNGLRLLGISAPERMESGDAPSAI